MKPAMRRVMEYVMKPAMRRVMEYVMKPVMKPVIRSTVTGMAAGCLCVCLAACGSPGKDLAGPDLAVPDSVGPGSGGPVADAPGGDTAPETGDTGGRDDSGSEDAQKEAQSRPQGGSAANIGDVKAQIGWEPGRKASLEEITALLDAGKIEYTGVINRTEERLDLELADGTGLLFLTVGRDTGEDEHFELMMIDGRLNENGFAEGYLGQYDVTSDELFYPDGESRLIRRDDLWYLNLTDLSIARNQIYARHGRKFKDPFLSAVFGTKNWYRPQYSAEEFDGEAPPFSETEKANLGTFQKLEKDRQNYRDGDGNAVEPARKILPGSWLDLDGDGRREQIHYEKKVDASGEYGDYVMEVNKDRVTGSGLNLYQYPSVFSLDGTSRLILAGSSGISDDPSNDIYLYQGGRLLTAGKGIPGNFQGYRDGKIYIKAQWDHFQSHITTYVYELEKNGNYIKEIPQSLYSYGNTATAKRDIPLYADETETRIGTTVKAGEEVVIEGSNLQSRVKIRRKKNGESGWLHCDLPYYCVLPDGTEATSTELFDDLPFFG